MHDRHKNAQAHEISKQVHCIMVHFTFLHLVFFGLVTFFIAVQSASGFSITVRNSYLASRVMKTVFLKDWLSCTLACQGDETCISYNYNAMTGSCDLNEHGIQEPCTDELVRMQGVVFHQIRPAKTGSPPRKVEPASQCDCSCTSESACRPGQDSYDSLPISCKEIWQKTKIRVDGTFYIRANPPSQYAHVFCHMTPIAGCGDGGWTLVMKINGNKQTFTYHSEYWSNTVAYNEGGGTNLAEVETKLSTYWSTPFTQLCLGMKYKMEENWIVLGHTGSSLYDVIANGTHTPTNLTIGDWKTLLNNCKLWDNCTVQGFNSGDLTASLSAKARIGIVGDRYSPCEKNGSFKSRIGFGTTGSALDMDPLNSCGNEFKSLVSSVRKKAFGYIFVQ